MSTLRQWLGRLGLLTLCAGVACSFVYAIVHGRDSWPQYVGALGAAAAITILIEGYWDARKPHPELYAAGHLYRVDPDSPDTIQPTPGAVFSTRLVHADECTSPGCPLVPYRKDHR